MAKLEAAAKPDHFNYHPAVCVILVALVIWALTSKADRPSSAVELNHDVFRLYYSCGNRTALRFQYSLTIDNGNAKRPRFFTFDPTISSSCQQLTTMSYSRVHPDYDRGHLVPSNHMDDSDTTILKANYMTNVVPQVKILNRGIWADTETIGECYRDIYPLDIYGGVIFSSDTRRDYFLSTHGIRTPAYFWKVVVAHPWNAEAKVISWLIPNQPELGPLEKYLVSVSDIESALSDQLGPIPIDLTLKSIRPQQNWKIPRHCDKS